MKIGTTAQRIAVTVAAIAALTALTGAAQAATTKPDRLSKAEYRALVLRSDALNEKYRLGQWKGMPAGMTASEYRALMLRSQAMNTRYGLGRSSVSNTASAANGTSHGFAWGAFSIGAVAMLGLVLLAAGVIGGSRFTRGTPRVRTS
jgi:hypothetical protein